jgi:hypothetical protein
MVIKRRAQFSRPKMLLATNSCREKVAPLFMGIPEYIFTFRILIISGESPAITINYSRLCRNGMFSNGKLSSSWVR